MRTQKKNESGLLNQNLCGSNEGFVTWKNGDPKDGVSPIAKMEWIAEMPGMRGTQGQQIKRAWDGDKGETDLKTATEKN